MQRIGVGDPTGKTVQDAWNESGKLPPVQIRDILDRWFSSSDPSSIGLGVERVAAATTISTACVLAGSVGVTAVAPFLAPVVAALAEIAVSEINNFLSNFGFLNSDSYCDHPEWQTKAIDDPLWFHYPGTVGVPAKGNEGIPDFPYKQVFHVPGWGKLGLPAVTPDIRDYPWTTTYLSQGLRIDFPALAVLSLPYPPVGSFEWYWYKLYARGKEINALQQCIRMSPADADTQDEALLSAFVANVWNPTHASSSNDTIYPGGANAGDDALLAKHTNEIHINRGAYLGAANVVNTTLLHHPGFLTPPTASSSAAGSLVKGALYVGAAGLIGAGIYSFVTKKSFVGVLKTGWKIASKIPKKGYRSVKKAAHIR